MLSVGLPVSIGLLVLMFLESQVLYAHLFFKRLYLFLQRGREGEREGEKHQCVFASQIPQLGTWPTTQAGALDWESNSNLSFLGQHSIY